MSDVEGTRTDEPTETDPRRTGPLGTGPLTAIEAAVLAVPGVAELYRPKPTIERTIAAIRGVRDTEPSPRIVVDAGELRVVIGTDGVVPAPRVARAVHDAVLAEAARHALELTRIDVRVARVG